MIDREQIIRTAVPRPYQSILDMEIEVPAVVKPEIPAGMREGASCPNPLKGSDLIREIAHWYAAENRSKGWFIDKISVSRALTEVSIAKKDGLMPDRKSAELKAIYERGLTEPDRNIINGNGTVLIDHSGTKIR